MMRIVGAAAIAVMALTTASPALAAEPSVPFADTVMSVHDAAVTMTAPTLVARFGADLNARFPTHDPLISKQFAAEVTALRHRFASSMMEFYPVANSGFHLSGGVRFFGVNNFAHDADKLTNNLLWSPSLHGSGGVRTGFKRQTPAATFGYTKTVAEKLAFGLEAGALMGRVNSSMRSSLGRGFSDGGDDHKMNPVANLVFGMKF